jgi:hypothetical protein
MRHALMLAAALASSTAVAGQIAVIDNANNNLMVFDTFTGTFNVVGNLGFDYSFGALAYNSATGALYLFDYSNTNMYRVDLNTGFASYIGTTGRQIIAAAYDRATGQLIAGDISGTGWYAVDPNTAGLFPLANFFITPSGAGWSDREGAIVYNQIGSATYYAYNVAFGTNTFLGGPGTFINDAGMTFDPDTGVYWIFDYNGTVKVADPNSGYTTFDVLAGLTNMDASELIGPSGPAPFTLTRSAGTCPGPETFTASNGTPNNQIAFVAGAPGGGFVIPSGACAGTVIPLGGPRLLGFQPSTPSGQASISGNVPAGACTRGLVAVDMATCAVSNVASP